MNLAYHFVALRNGNPVLRDGLSLPAVGEWLEQEGPIVICERGLHASYRAFDALGYAPTGVPLGVCLVEVDGVETEQADKLVCRRRRVLAWAPCDWVLRLFARECALSVLHLWQGEVPAVVREYLETGNEEIRAAARAAAWDAAWDAARAAAWDAARAAAWDAAWDAARAAARDAARAAAWDAARDAAWDAARAAARDAARAAARAAAWDAARAAAWDAARAAAWDAARAAAWDAARAAAISDLNVTLESMLLAEMEWA
jgi:hypothetical protein